MTTPPRRLRFATRGSRLALTQTRIVADLVDARVPSVDVEIVTVSTKGDRDARPFSAIGGKGLFVSEVERAVVEGRADAAVHSAKDLTAELAAGCTIACVPPRASAHDVVIGGAGATGEERLLSLPSGARVGTSSMRRRALVAELRHDLELVELRGNVDTRLRKVADGEVAAAILAAAGMERLGEGSQAAPLSLGVWVPAPGQGALAVEVRRDRPELLELFGALEDPETRAELTCERAFARVVEGGCSVPLGCHAAVRGGHIAVTGFLGDPSTRTFLRRRASGPRAEAGATGERLARELMEAGGKEILASLSAREVPGVSAP